MDNNLGKNRRKITPTSFSQIKGGEIAHFGFHGALSLISRGLGFVVLFQSIQCCSSCTVHFRPTVDLLR